MPDTATTPPKDECAREVWQVLTKQGEQLAQLVSATTKTADSTGELVHLGQMAEKRDQRREEREEAHRVREEEHTAALELAKVVNRGQVMTWLSKEWRFFAGLILIILALLFPELKPILLSFLAYGGEVSELSASEAIEDSEAALVEAQDSEDSPPMLPEVGP